MTHLFLANLWHLLFAVIWAVYIFQESFVVGSSFLSMKYSDDSQSLKKINNAVGTHWDGIEVWLILAIAGQFAAFPKAFAINLSSLYVPVFLLFYAIILRGVTIELLYKFDEPKYFHIAARVWQISSLVLILIVGVYVTNFFVGLPLDANMNANSTFFSFMGIFNFVGLLGGGFVVALSLVLGPIFMYYNVGEKEYKDCENIRKWSGVVVTVCVVGILMGLNNKYEAFSRGVYQEYSFLWALPIGTIVSCCIFSVSNWFDKKVLTFALGCVSTLLLMFSGFVSMMPYSVVSKIDINNSILIVDAAAGDTTLKIMLVGTVVFLPVVIGYQLYKYIKFWGVK